MPFASLLTSICRPTSRTSARCARKGCRSSNRGRGPWRRKQGTRSASFQESGDAPDRTLAEPRAPDRCHLQDHARLRRHRFRRLAAAGRRRLDPGAARRRPCASSTAETWLLPAQGEPMRASMRWRRSQRSPSTARSSPRRVVRAMNARLPPAVRVMTAEEAPDSFHARFSARAKSYRYRRLERRRPAPFERSYAWHRRRVALDVDAMAAAARVRQGRTRFRGVSNGRRRCDHDRPAHLSIRDQVRDARCEAIHCPNAAFRSDRVRGYRRRVPAAHGAGHCRLAGRGRATAVVRPNGLVTSLRAAIAPTPVRPRRQTACSWCQSVMAPARRRDFAVRPGTSRLSSTTKAAPRRRVAPA